MNMLDPRSQQKLHLKIGLRQIKYFTETFRSVIRFNTGKHEIRISVTVNIGSVSGLMICGKIDEDDIKNADETNFIINVDNGHTMGF